MTTQYDRRRPHRRRTGLAVVVVLLLISLTLALSYSVLRSQSAAVTLQGNTQLDQTAKLAAQTGLSVALRKMSDGSWTGVGTTTTTSLATNQSFTTTYTVGDATLTASNPNFNDNPYRVTINVTGRASDPARPNVVATYGTAAVVRLVPRQLATNPATLSAALPFTIYQTGTADFELQLPCQVTGPTRVQGNFRLCDTYPGTSYGLSRYLGDLTAMNGNGYGDYRPVTGTVNVPSGRISSATRTLLTSQLGVSCVTISSSSTSGWSFPGAVSSYRLYPGGQVYMVPVLGGSTFSNATLSADVGSNPLGIFYRNGSITLNSNVNIQGTLIVNGDVIVSGQNVVLNAPTFLAVQGSSAPPELPVVVCNGNFRVTSGATATVSGLVASWSNFDCAVGATSTSLNFQGRVIANGFTLQERNEWNIGSFWWSLTWSWFSSQLSSSSPVNWYPVYSWALWGLNPTPLVNVGQETTPVTYVWKDQTNTPYVAGSGDAGLVWQVLRTSESP